MSHTGVLSEHSRGDVLLRTGVVEQWICQYAMVEWRGSERRWETEVPGMKMNGWMGMGAYDVPLGSTTPMDSTALVAWSFFCKPCK
jgi:hypothetical protein